MAINPVLMGMLKGTPWYVYGIFVYLLFIGIRSMRPYALQLKVLFILPVALCAWMLVPVFKYHDPFMFVYFMAGIGLGFIVWRLLPVQKFVIDLVTRTVTYEGTWTMLPLFMSIFVVKYMFGYMHATQAQFIVTYPWAEYVVAGCIAGIFVARTLHVYYHYRLLTKQGS